MSLNKKEIKGLFKSFTYAFRGLIYCIKNERNMRIHITVSAIVFPFSFVYDLTRTEYAILVLIMGLVMVCELINTAMEALVNLGSESYDSLARIAKDVAAGAVLMCATASVMVGIAIFGHPYKLINSILIVLTNPFYLMFFIFVIVAGIFFIFKGIDNKRIKIKKKDKVRIYIPKTNTIKQIDNTENVKIYTLKGENRDK